MHPQDTPPQPTTPSMEVISQKWRTSGEEWTRKTDEATKKGKTLVLSGHGVKMNVNRGALIVKDGMTHSTHDPQTHTLYRGVHGIERIVIVSPTGSVTFDALRWCEQQKIVVQMIFEEDGDEVAEGLSSAGGRETSDLKLRRAQYEARFTGQDVLISRWLVLEKLRSQVQVLQWAEKQLWILSPSVVPAMRTTLERLDRYPHQIEQARSIDSIMQLERNIAGEFYGSFRDIPVKWAPRDKKLVPEHWLTIGGRLSGLPSKTGPRYASTPANAIRNLAFTVLANHVRVAAAVRGFDVACGWLHADKEYRDSLVYDLMEPYRPVIDQKVIELVTSAKFTYGDFVTTKEGQVRLHPALAKFVVSTCVVPWTEIDLSQVEKLLMAPQ